MRFADSDVGLIRFVGPCRRFIKEIVAFGVLKHSHDHLHCPVDRIVGKPVQHFGNTRRATRRYWQDLPHGVATLVRSAKYGRVSGRRQITSLRGGYETGSAKKARNTLFLALYLWSGVSLTRHCFLMNHQPHRQQPVQPLVRSPHLQRTNSRTSVVSDRQLR